jgi:hypothetical protein
VTVANGTSPSGVGRWVPLSGVAFVVLSLVAIIGLGGNTPDDGASAAHVAAYYNSHQGHEEAAAFVLAAAAPFMAFFGIYLATTFTGQFGRHLLVVGTTAVSVVWIIAAFVHFALADGANHLTPDVMQGLNMLDSDSWVGYNSGLGIFMLAAAITLLGGRVSYRRLGWVALPIGVVLFIPFVDFIGLLLAAVWILVTSVMLTRKAPSPLVVA